MTDFSHLCYSSQKRGGTKLLQTNDSLTNDATVILMSVFVFNNFVDFPVIYSDMTRR